MTATELYLLIMTSIAQLITAVAQLIIAMRQRW